MTTKKKWRPVGYMVLVKPDFETKTASGLLLAHVSDREGIAAVDTGVVVDIGPTAWRAYDNGEPWCKVGDRICYARFGGKIVKVPDQTDDEKLVLIADGDVRLVLEEVND